MLPDKLDALFPYIVFAYGTLVTLALASRRLQALGERFVDQEAWARFRGHRGLAAICLAVGAAWILENLWFA